MKITDTAKTASVRLKKSNQDSLKSILFELCKPKELAIKELENELKTK